MATAFFDLLLGNHPALESPPVIEPCSTRGNPNHVNQCVIRLGVSFVRSGISLASYRGAFCWSGHGRQHPLRVEEMKLWLNSENVTFVGYAEISRRDRRGHQASYHAYAGQRGIVAFLNFHGRGNQGDHIDLWDGSAMAHGDPDYFQRSQEIWFWKMD
jgi:Type VI secretion system (T6SS), amidase effector protein 4